MKAFVLDSNSWHFWLSNFGARRIWPDEETDICEYTRAVISGTFSLFAVTLFWAIISAWVGFSFYNLGEYLFGYVDKVIPTTVMFFGVILALTGAITYIFIKEKVVDYLDNREPSTKEPGFATLAYRKFKDKTCARIEFRTKE